MEDAEEGFDQFEVAREDILHEFLAGFGESDDGDAAAAAGYVLQGAMEVGALEFDGGKSDDSLADPSEGGDARDDSGEDATAGVEAVAEVADGKRAFAVEEFEEAEIAHGDVEGGERAAELGFHPFGGVDEDGAGAEGALGSVAVGEARDHGAESSRFDGGRICAILRRGRSHPPKPRMGHPAEAPAGRGG